MSLALLVAICAGMSDAGRDKALSKEPASEVARETGDGIPAFYVTAYVTNPQWVSVSLISGFTMRGTAADDAKGVFFELEPGLGGGKIAVGHGSVAAHGDHRNWKVAVLRTWGDPWGMRPDETFVGAEAAVGVMGLSFRLGAFGEVSGGKDNWLVSGGIGFLFN